ncbi:PorT family protein [Subsaxibacter sp. CAU 1640]|uniref:outer membrane beta-barrel protein n=1 Tax=Subsaxibacter sp. CAU 1640 TaxID=2933271 RepID=UPI002005E20E|nr:outer membrane beta-barrel protein [Subsaxibacter sp. CAU 1640]MCK7590968.1 PorT family protein [Subsaxibacter sp. CAU 1640]
MKYLLCFVMTISSLLCNAQVREKGDIEIIPVIGYSISYQLDSFLFGSSSINGIQFGAYANYHFNSRWSLRTGMLYQKMGTNSTDFFIFVNEYSERTNYLTIPLTLNFHFGKNRNWYAHYGPAIGILTKAEANYNDGNGYIDIKSLASTTQFGVNGGIGYKFNIAPQVLGVVENYNFLGFTDSTDQKSGKNFHLSLNLGVIFKI